MCIYIRSAYIFVYMAVSILYLSFYNHKTITEQTLKFRVGEAQAKWKIELDLPRVHIYWYINLGAYFLLKCLRLSWVWPAALNSFCMLRLK